MELKHYKYVPRSGDRQEQVECEVYENGTLKTTCFMDVECLFSGIYRYGCEDNTGITLTLQEINEIFDFLHDEHERVRSSYPVKTYEGWLESGFRSFAYFCYPGDTVDEAMVSYFMDIVPPKLYRSACSQSGEPTDMVNGRAIYPTFHRIGKGLWKFDGYCFYGENTDRYPFKSAFDEKIRRSKEFYKETITCK